MNTYTTFPHSLRRRTVRLLVALSSVAFLTACSAISYDGEHTEDGTYTGQPRVYLLATDTLAHCSFALDAPDVTTKTVRIPVQLMGYKPQTPLPITVTIDPASTAQQGTQYDALATVQFAPDSLRAWIEVQVQRNGLPNTEQGNYFLRLHLVSGSGYVVERDVPSTVTISMDDYLAKPEWWDTMFGGLFKTYYFGEYTREKYIKWLEQYNYDVARMEQEVSPYNENYSAWLFGSFRKVYQYFAAHPELNQTFGTYAYTLL